MRHMRFLHPSKTGVKSLKFEGESLVVNSHTMEDGGVHIVDMHGILNDIVTVIVCGAMDVAAFDPSTRHPN